MLGGKNSKNKHPRGYTIIEVMIVLAVSGVMFLIAANFINGKQAKTAFTEGVNDTVSRLQDTIEQVTDGQYSDIPLNCQFNPNTQLTSFPTYVTPAGQGQNSQCVFLGKLWYFNLVSDPKTSKYKVLSVAGGRVDTNGAVITDPAAAAPAVVPDLSTDQVVNQSLDITNIYYYADDRHYVETSPSIQAFGFLQSQGSADTNGNLASGAQTMGLYYVDGVFNLSSHNIDTASGAGGKLQATKGIALCVSDGQRYALITVGVAGDGSATGNPLSVDADMTPHLHDCEGGA